MRFHLNKGIYCFKTKQNKTKQNKNFKKASIQMDETFSKGLPGSELMNLVAKIIIG